MINLKFLNYALGRVSSDEFAALYALANAISLKKCNHVKLYREELADKLGWLDTERPQYGVKKVTNITNNLEKKGFLKKNIVFENPPKKATYYSLNTQILDTNNDTLIQKNIHSSNIEKELKRKNNNKNEIDENPIDGFSQFPLKEHEELHAECLEKGASTYECYSTFAKGGQDSFNWLCLKLNEDETFYTRTADTRQGWLQNFNYLFLR